MPDIRVDETVARIERKLDALCHLAVAQAFEVEGTTATNIVKHKHCFDVQGAALKLRKELDDAT